jgi:heavy metal sensor kinase
MNIRSIRVRLTLWYTSLLTVTFFVLGGAAYGLLVYSLSRDLDASLRGVAQVLAKQARKENALFFPSSIDEAFRRFFGFSPLDRHFEMLDPLGHRDPRHPRDASKKLMLSPKALENGSRGIPTFETLEGAGQYPVRVLTMPVIKAGRVSGFIQAGMSLENMYRTRRHFLLVMAVVLPIALLLAGGGGWLLARRALEQVDRMTKAARRISAEHLAERLEETETGDELDSLAKTLNEMLGRLDASFSQIRQFSANASHELQTPLTILKGELEVALRSPRTPEEYQEILVSALEEIDRIAQLVEGLLLLARADAGVLRMDRQPVELLYLVEEVFDRVKVLADAHSVALRLGHLERVSVQGDYERLRRLLLNLVDNAIKYSSPGGRVTLSVQVDGERAFLQISDTGVGLKREEKEQIFQPFYRTAEARSVGERGVGLGLSIARSIAEAHGGKIEVESTPGQGSTFTVLLPIPS